MLTKNPLVYSIKYNVDMKILIIFMLKTTLQIAINAYSTFVFCPSMLTPLGSPLYAQYLSMRTEQP